MKNKEIIEEITNKIKTVKMLISGNKKRLRIVKGSIVMENFHEGKIGAYNLAMEILVDLKKTIRKLS